MKNKRPLKYYQDIGAKGGAATLKAHGKEYMQKIALKGGKATKKKYKRYAKENKI